MATYIEAAELLLAEEGAPLHFRELTRRAMERDLIEVQGMTPWNSMNGSLRRYIRQKSDEAGIVSLGDGRFALSAWGLPHQDIAKDPADAFDEEAWMPPLPQWGEGPLGARLSSFIGEQGLTLLAARPRHPLYARAYGLMRTLFIWSLGSLLGGALLALGQRTRLLRGLASQWLLWGAAGSMAAVVGMETAARDDADLRAERVDYEQPVRRAARYGAYANRGLVIGALAVGLGLLLGRQGDSRSALRGAAAGLLTQGSALLLVSALAGWLMGDRR